jgi:dTDP-4-amino-4,6-dideoxygalactose transaminase
MIKASEQVPFNKPYLTGRELSLISEAHLGGQLSGAGRFTRLCETWLESLGGSPRALLTHSCTAALEMAAILCDITPGDEVIMPSYTFVSTANAFVLRGGVPVFVDIRMDTLNIDEQKIEAAITPRTKAIVVVHYGGVACEMDPIMELARSRDLLVIEDAAQAIMATYKGRQLGTIGDLGCFSFHETKNLISGEGGALLVNRRDMVNRAEIIREKGTNRTQFNAGKVDKYTWQDLGSSFLPGEVIAAFLWGQIQDAAQITQRRMEIWNEYSVGIRDVKEGVSMQMPPGSCKINAHSFYIVYNSRERRELAIRKLAEKGIGAVTHYVPLHSSPFGKKVARSSFDMQITDWVAEGLVRLPLWVGLQKEHQLMIRDVLLSS